MDNVACMSALVKVLRYVYFVIPSGIWRVQWWCAPEIDEGMEQVGYSSRVLGQVPQLIVCLRWLPNEALGEKIHFDILPKG